VSLAGILLSAFNEAVVIKIRRKLQYKYFIAERQGPATGYRGPPFDVGVDGCPFTGGLPAGLVAGWPAPAGSLFSMLV
jgi:hypothetical protein